MTIVEYLSNNTPLLLTYTGVLGLLIGSFLNVVIYRLPVMMQSSWLGDCLGFLQEQHQLNISSQLDLPHGPSQRFNLIVPRSTCPKCKHKITALENIPVISYLFLRGKCRACANPISLRYPFVELLTAIISVLTVYHFGFGIQAGCALLFAWCLIALSFIDIDHQILPDDITLGFLWFGLFINLFGVFTDINSAIIGAIVGYLSLWTIYWLFKIITKKEGMGYGDFKLLAMFGAWLGWQALPLIILLSSLVGAAIGITLIVLKKQDSSKPIPFGPYLAIAGWIALIWGDKMTSAYLNYSGLQELCMSLA